MTAAFVLDCETQESVLQSLCSAYRCEPKDLTAILGPIDLDAIYESPDAPLVDVPDFLYEHLESALGSPDMPAEICWFHFTRTTPGNSFTGGICPLGEVLPKIWNTMLDLAPSPEVRCNLAAFMRNGVPDFQFGLKAPNSVHWGPYGYLVPAVAGYSRELSQHDYLGMPEIVEDICNGYRARHGISLIEHYRNVLVPCTVKFKHPAEDRGHDTLGVAASYLYGCLRKETPSSSWITCFDGNGKGVQAEAILSVTLGPIDQRLTHAA